MKSKTSVFNPKMMGEFDLRLKQQRLAQENFSHAPSSATPSKIYICPDYTQKSPIWSRGNRELFCISLIFLIFTEL
jgi:hypothetical protein